MWHFLVTITCTGAQYPASWASRSKVGTCIKGLIWPPLELKTENCLSQNYFDWFSRRMTEVLNFGIYLNFTLAMVTKMADKIGIK